MARRAPLTSLAPAPLALAAVFACGSRTALDDWSGPQTEPGLDASPTTDDGSSGGYDVVHDATGSVFDDTGIDAKPPDPSTLPNYYPGSCYGRVTSTPNITCTFAEYPGNGGACEGTLDCEGHFLRMHCENGSCTCDNPGFNVCYCQAPPHHVDPCGSLNCCWQ